MNFNSKLLILITLVFIASVGIVVAEDATVEPYTFTVPDGYTITTSDDTTCAMQKDEKNAVSFATGVSDDLEAAKQNFIDQGKTLIKEESMNYNDFNITLQAFSTDADGTTLYAYNYIVLSEDGNFVVTVATDDEQFDSDLKSDDNPAKIIFDTIHK